MARYWLNSRLRLITVLLHGALLSSITMSSGAQSGFSFTCPKPLQPCEEVPAGSATNPIPKNLGGWYGLEQCPPDSYWLHIDTENKKIEFVERVAGDQPVSESEQAADRIFAEVQWKNSRYIKGNNTYWGGGSYEILDRLPRDLAALKQVELHYRMSTANRRMGMNQCLQGPERPVQFSIQPTENETIEAWFGICPDDAAFKASSTWRACSSSACIQENPCMNSYVSCVNSLPDKDIESLCPEVLVDLLAGMAIESPVWDVNNCSSLGSCPGDKEANTDNQKCKSEAGIKEARDRLYKELFVFVDDIEQQEGARYRQIGTSIYQQLVNNKAIPSMRGQWIERDFFKWEANFTDLGKAAILQITNILWEQLVAGGVLEAVPPPEIQKKDYCRGNTANYNDKTDKILLCEDNIFAACRDNGMEADIEKNKYMLEILVEEVIHRYQHLLGLSVIEPEVMNLYITYYDKVSLDKQCCERDSKTESEDKESRDRELCPSDPVSIHKLIANKLSFNDQSIILQPYRLFSINRLRFPGLYIVTDNNNSQESYENQPVEHHAKFAARTIVDTMFSCIINPCTP